MAGEVVVDALPYIDQGYDEPGVREGVSKMFIKNDLVWPLILPYLLSNWRSVNVKSYPSAGCSRGDGHGTVVLIVNGIYLSFLLRHFYWVTSWSNALGSMASNRIGYGHLKIHNCIGPLEKIFTRIHFQTKYLPEQVSERPSMVIKMTISPSILRPHQISWTRTFQSSRRHLPSCLTGIRITVLSI